jgi:uncharacterized protein YbjT (DUF2867 family)
MRILVTGGTGVIGTAVITELMARNHSVRLLSRHAAEDAKQWKGVEPREGNVSDPATLHGAADRCDVVVHIAGIVTENPPDLTFENVNVLGTANVLAEAERAGVRKFIFASSLGADRGSTEYHQSKLRGEQAVRQSSLDWTILRFGNVYGPGDEVISLLVKMVRALPVVPVINRGDQPFQPIWHEDAGRVVVNAIERSDIARQTLEVAGPEVTTMKDLVDRLREITDRKTAHLPIPSVLASLGSRALGAVTRFPIDDTKLTMLQEENVISRGKPNGLETFGVAGTGLDEGLRKLVDTMPEQLPEDGVGSMQHKRFWADIRGSVHSATRLMTLFRDGITDIMPIEFAAEPGAPTRVERGATMTAALPMRGNIQIRVEVVEPTRTVFATLEGHPLAGTVEFTTADEPDGVRFAIDVYTRAANVFDFVALKTVGAPAQSANWRAVVQRMVERSGGTSEGVKTEIRTLDDEEAARVEKGVRSMVQKRQRQESSPAERST